MMASSTQFQPLVLGVNGTNFLGVRTSEIPLALVKEAVSRLQTRTFKKEDEAKRRLFVPAQVPNINKVNQTVRGDIEWPTF
jgi:hypothetical protein